MMFSLPALTKNNLGQVIRQTFSFKIVANIVALQVEKRCCPYYHRVLNLPRNKFQCCKLKKKMLKKVELGSPLRKILLQLATLKFVAWQVEHAVVIRATTRSTCNVKMLRAKLNENVARITWLFLVSFYFELFIKLLWCKNIAWCLFDQVSPETNLKTIKWT